MEAVETAEEPQAGGADVFLRQLVDLYVAPEIERRKNAGRLSDGFALQAAQVICFPDGRPMQVRLNQEVQAIMLVHKADDAELAVGDAVYAHQIDDIETIVLPQSEDPNCGHATMLRLAGEWYLVFDFRYNRGSSRVLLDRADQFLAAAKAMQAGGQWSAFAYNLFTAMELAAKARLLVVPDEQFRDAKSHKSVHSRFNRWAKHGNVSTQQSSTLNKLFHLRQQAAYSLDRFTLDATEATALREVVEDFIVTTGDSIARRLPDRST